MTAPRLDNPVLGQDLSAEPILQGGLSREDEGTPSLESDTKRPLGSSPLKNSTLAADLDPISPATPSNNNKGPALSNEKDLGHVFDGLTSQSGSVDNVLEALTGAVA